MAIIKKVDIYSFTLSLTSVIEGVGARRHAPAALPSGKHPAPIV
jgi:hypothetical protein